MKIEGLHIDIEYPDGVLCRITHAPNPYITEAAQEHARLVEAAPNLLEAAEMAEEFITTESMGPTEMARVLTKLRAAIALTKEE